MSNIGEPVLVRESRIPSIGQKNELGSNEELETRELKIPEKLLRSNDMQNPRLNPETFSPPRIKVNKNKKTSSSSIFDGEHQSPTKKGNFSQFLSKIEIFQKTKNDKIMCLQALKKQKEELELKSIPKARMSEMSKKILEEKKKRTGKFLKTSTPNVVKVKREKLFTYSTQNAETKAKIASGFSFEAAKLQTKPSKDVLNQDRSEKVLASKFLKDYTKTFDSISKGKSVISEEEARMLLKRLSFMPKSLENSIKAEIEEKLFARMWKITGSGETKSISIDSLKNFSLGVMNFYLPSMAHNQPGVKFGRVIFNKYHLNQEEVQRIHKLFLPFYENRVNSMKNFSQKSIKTQESLKSLKIGNLSTASKLVSHKGRSSRSFGKFENLLEEKLKASTARVIEKSLGRSSCETPISNELSLNTSFRSARSKSRLKILGKDSFGSSLSETEWVGVSHDQISDPSIILKAQDVLGAFKVKKAETSKKIEKSEERQTGRKAFALGKSSSQKIIFNTINQGLKTVAARPIDEGLKKVRELLSERKGNEDLVVDVNLPDGLQKTLVIPNGSNKIEAVQKFVDEHNLSLEMARALLNSIKNS